MSSKRRRLVARNFAVILIFTAGRSCRNGFSGLSRNGPLASVVQRLGSTTQGINHYPMDKYYQNRLSDPVNRDLSAGYWAISNHWTTEAMNELVLLFHKYHCRAFTQRQPNLHCVSSDRTPTNHITFIAIRVYSVPYIERGISFLSRMFFYYYSFLFVFLSAKVWN